MWHSQIEARGAGRSRRMLGVLVFSLCAFAGQALGALTLSPTSVTLPSKTYITVKITGAAGEIQAESANTAIATVNLTSVTSSSATLNVYGVAGGTATVYVRDKNTSNKSLPVKVTAAIPAMTLSPTTMSLSVGATGNITASNNSGSVTASSASTKIATVSVSGNVVTVKGVAAGITVVAVRDSKVTVNVPVTVLGSIAGSAKYALIAWNDLGMHCMDGKDYSVMSILPPFNNLHAQLVNATTGKAVTKGVTLTYEAVADRSGSINTYSANPAKTNFWDHALSLYWQTLAVVQATSTPTAPAGNVGLTGNMTPSLTAKPMTLDAGNGWFEASGVPITPYADNVVNKTNKNYYPTVKVVATDDATKQVLASTITVLPVSDEITCIACHGSIKDTDPLATTTRLAAKPASPGWVFDADAEKDWKRNILRLHDQKYPATAPELAAVKLDTAGLETSAAKGQPVLCASCHTSNALPGTGLPGIPALTSALHTTHGQVGDPVSGVKLDDASNRSACYMCHPGSVTACLRGAMSTVSEVQCQSCHGKMSNVGAPARVGWLQQPSCQACHFDGKRTFSAVDGSGNLLPAPADKRFATNPDKPIAGFSLFRFSKGHGGLQCESCHGSTHAEYPSTHVNDNEQSIALQGYAGTIRECTVCHATTPSNVLNGGPHGMHLVGASWVSRHGDMVASSGSAACAYCHGSDYKGSPLAQIKAPRSFAIEGGTKSYAAKQNVGCYDCHNGPNP